MGSTRVIGLSLENVGLEYCAQYKQNPKYDRHWSEYHPSPPVLIEEMTVSEWGETEAYGGHTKGDEDNAVQRSLWVRINHSASQTA